MKKTVRLTESDLTRLVKRIISESPDNELPGYNAEWDSYKTPDSEEDIDSFTLRTSRRNADSDYALYQMKKSFTQPILDATTEEEIMDAILNLADLAKYRKRKPFKK